MHRVFTKLAPAASGKSERGVIMTREEAITYGERKKARIQEKLCRDGSSYGDYSIYYSEMEFTSAAVTALQEQEERERGCEYCHEDGDGYRKMIGAFSITNPFHGDVWNLEARHCKPRQINFCPMCGRRLHLPKPTTKKANS